MKDSLNVRKSLKVGNKEYHYFSLPDAEKAGLAGISKLPFSLKILLENLLRNEDGNTVTLDDIKALSTWLKTKSSSHEIAYRPARVLMQDYTGVPAVVDLAAMRAAMVKLGGDPEKINPLTPVDLVIDHSVQVDKFANPEAFKFNVQLEMHRNRERYEFLRWGQQAFKNFQAVPPGTGICHQVNLEYLGKTVWTSEKDGKLYAYPDTLVGTDSHTTMINGLGILGWGVGGIEAEAAMLGQPISMLIPEVIGMRFTGKLNEGVTATDLVLSVTHILRKKGVVGKFVEFFGSGLDHLPLADRATIANMAPEYGATCGLFPIDEETIKYLKLTGRDEQTVQLVESYSKAQGMWRSKNQPEAEYTEIVELNLADVEASIAGPSRPQDQVLLGHVPARYAEILEDAKKTAEHNSDFSAGDYNLHHGDVVIAAITSCTNTSNPSVLMAAGLLAKNALAKGLKTKPWVKTSFAPGSKVVTDYLQHAGLQTYLDQLGFNLVGYGCTTCIGNSGPLPDNISKTITDNDLIVSAVLSGNRNFEGRIHPQVKASWLASPPLVVAYALAGSSFVDLTKQPIGKDQQGKDIYLKDIWPSSKDIAAEVAKVSVDMFHKEYAKIFDGDADWQALPIPDSKTYTWPPKSTYIQHPPFFADMPAQPVKPADIMNARVLALFGDSITTDHISPAGNIKLDSPAGKYLMENGVEQKDFNSYGARRGNHQVMMRGTFANIRIRNEMLKNVEGGFTTHYPSKEQLSIYDAAMRYQKEKVALVVVAGKDYGGGSSRDWAAKGTLLLGVKAVIAESYERIHRSNLIGMGVLPLEFMEGTDRKSLKLDGSEQFSIITQKIAPGASLLATLQRADGSQKTLKLHCRIDTQNELEYYQQGGILQYVIRQLAA